MGLWQRIKKEVIETFTVDPKERYTIKHQETQDAMARRGWVQQCRECKQTFAKNKKICDTCECSADTTAPRRVILNKVYQGRDPSGEAKRIGDILATCGWYAITQSAGGTMKYTFNANRNSHAGEINVTYKRD